MDEHTISLSIFSVYPLKIGYKQVYLQWRLACAVSQCLWNLGMTAQNKSQHQPFSKDIRTINRNMKNIWKHDTIKCFHFSESLNITILASCVAWSAKQKAEWTSQGNPAAWSRTIITIWAMLSEQCERKWHRKLWSYVPRNNIVSDGCSRANWIRDHCPTPPHGVANPCVHWQILHTNRPALQYCVSFSARGQGSGRNNIAVIAVSNIWCEWCRFFSFVFSC